MYPVFVGSPVRQFRLQTKSDGVTCGPMQCRRWVQQTTPMATFLRPSSETGKRSIARAVCVQLRRRDASSAFITVDSQTKRFCVESKPWLPLANPAIRNFSYTLYRISASRAQRLENTMKRNAPLEKREQ